VIILPGGKAFREDVVEEGKENTDPIARIKRRKTSSGLYMKPDL